MSGDVEAVARAELLPCPFCGGEAYIDGTEDAHFFVGCRDCFCNVGESYDRDAMPEHMFYTVEDAAKAWNTRAAIAADPVRQELIEALVYLTKSDAEGDYVENRRGILERAYTALSRARPGGVT